MAACGHISASSQLLRFILSLRMNSSLITLRPNLIQKKSRHIVVIIDVKRLVILNVLAGMTHQCDGFVIFLGRSESSCPSQLPSCLPTDLLLLFLMNSSFVDFLIYMAALTTITNRKTSAKFMNQASDVSKA